MYGRFWSKCCVYIQSSPLFFFKPVLLVSCIHVEMSSVVFYSISGITMKLKGKTRDWIIPHESRTDIIAGPDVGNSIDVDGVLE